jgi:hypothetical protein
VLTYGLEAPDSVEKRRHAVGLPPLQPVRPQSPDEPSRGAMAHSGLTGMELWARRTGWRK